MCLYPKLIRNKKYLPNNKNNGNVPEPKDARVLYVPIGCGNCIECRTQKAREWQVRLNEEIKVYKGYFVTLTFSEESINKLMCITKTSECNAIAGIAVRRFLERWRRHNGKSLRHWLITELGHENTERIHLHGIIFTNENFTNEILSNYWKYGRTDVGQYCNGRTINYIVKYVTKIDNDHKQYKPQIFCSAGLGSNFINEQTKIRYKYKPKNAIEYYTLPNGQKINLPIYYRNKLFTEEERENIWLDRLDKDTRYIRGIEIRNASKNENKIFSILEEQQRFNIFMGYGDDSKEWKKAPYNATLKTLNAMRTLQKMQKIK